MTLITKDAETLAMEIWNASRADEGTISATGANIVAKALIASGAVVDVSTLTEDDAEAAFWREQEAGTTMRDRGGYFHAGFLAGFRALAVALAETGGTP